ncbi:MAG: V4R domain-containing protein [Nitrososphaerales archaeon]
MSRFYTGHEVFDEIVMINHGSSILILDESFMEAKNLLLTLLKKERPFELVSHKVETLTGQILAIGDLSLSDASVTINKLRSDAKGSTIIHDYFPDFIIKYESEAFLRLLGAWREQIRDNKTVEFYILPKGAFKEVERKIMSIVDGVIEIKVKRVGKGFGLSFIVMRCCKPEWHLHEFSYRIEDSRVLIEWEGEYTDKLPKITLDEIKQRVESYKKDLPFLKVEIGTGTPLGLSTYDYWLLSQIESRDLLSLKMLLYEKFDEVLEKIAKWHIMGYLRVVKKSEKLANESNFHVGKPISWKTKLALKMPLKIALLFLRSPHIRTVPADVYMAEKRAFFEFLKIFFGDRTELGIESIESVLGLEERFHEMVGRIKAVKDVQRFGEDVSTSIDIKYLPKIVKMVMWVGYKLDCNISDVSLTSMLITVRDCFLCEGIRSAKPICRAISGALTGACSLTFKRVINCKEIKCKALGDEHCIFELKVVK